ncbi:TonB-dependent receptor domain-containing protein [Aliikangiella sp. IMCC44359]|uniref:TonB-dependent receptor domain-containing protein n=1 Tax=Aliikangiella sp. IMCC44359 TaxID=3459125 RepID=UPI00403ACD7E
MKIKNTQRLITQAVRSALMIGASSSLLITSNIIAAEETENKADETQKILITGSRLPRNEISQPSPIVSIGEDELKSFGTPDLGSILSELSAVAATDSLAGNAGAAGAGSENAGTSSANLRSLGANRTLTLVNGKRHVAGSQGSAQVDLSTIPVSLVERVEIITGGASAIYGSDAVTGVINIILRDNFEGFEFNMSGATSLESVGANSSNVNFLAGANFAEDKGNVTFSFGREYTQEILYTDLQHLNNNRPVENPASQGENDGIPDFMYVPNNGSEMINRFGVLNPFSDPQYRYTFREDGTPILQTTREFTNSFAFGSFPDGCDTCFLEEDYFNLLPEVEKITAFSRANYSLNDNVNFYGEFKFVRSDIEQQYQPGFIFGGINISLNENPYIDPGLKQTFLDLGASNLRMAKFFDELGNRKSLNRRETVRFVAGVNGFVELGTTEIDYDLFYVNGKTSNRRETTDVLIFGNAFAALDAVIDPATGQAACRSQVPSAQGSNYIDPATFNADQCMPYNPFGFGNASQAARDFVSTDVASDDEIGQEYFGIHFTFDTGEFLNLPGGPIGVALGYEYREEYSGETTDAITKSGITNDEGLGTPNSFGEYDVTESFIEFQLPILSKVKFAEELTIDMAYRNAKYSHAGKADAWKVGLMYAPVEQIRIRGTIGESVRAPNITEAFAPISPGFFKIDDPCDADLLGDNENRAVNCAALGIPADFQANDNEFVNTLSGGNPELEAEVSRSATFGLVWTPDFIEDFSVSIDSFKVEIEEAIILLNPQTIASNCVGASGGPDEFYCSKVTRDLNTGDIRSVETEYINASRLNAEGIETEFRYKTSLDTINLPGVLSTSLFVSKMEVLEQFEFQDRPDEININLGEVGNPEYQARLALGYNLDDLTINWTSRFIERSATFDQSGIASEEDLSPAYVGSLTTHDLSASYVISDNMRIYGGIRNINNKLPPSFTQNTIYDILGRRAFAGIQFSF